MAVFRIKERVTDDSSLSLFYKLIGESFYLTPNDTYAIGGRKSEGDMLIGSVAKVDVLDSDNMTWDIDIPDPTQAALFFDRMLERGVPIHSITNAQKPLSRLEVKKKMVDINI
jgi:hypothetical protein